MSAESRSPSARFEAGVRLQAITPAAAVRRRPAGDSVQETQILFGEEFLLYDAVNGWAWGQTALDDYAGYVEAAALSADVLAPTHRISVVRAAAFAQPDHKAPVAMTLAMNARVTVEAASGGYAHAARAGWISTRQLAPLDAPAPDWVAEAEKLRGAPYVWGGRENIGLDCSGLVQTALLAAGIAAPRDSDMMERVLGAPVSGALRRGDLVFWPGHVGVMVDGARLLHANAHHMAAVIEPLAAAEARAGPARAARRLPQCGAAGAAADGAGTAEGAAASAGAAAGSGGGIGAGEAASE